MSRGCKHVPRRLCRQYGREGVGHRRPREQLRAGQHLPQHHTERPDVCALVHHRPARLLGAHVGRSAQDHARLGHRRGCDRGRIGARARRRAGLQGLGQAEIEHLHRAIGPHLDVGGFQVAVNDAALVRGFERFGDLAGEHERFGNGNRPTCDALRQVFPLDQLHHDGRHPATLFQSVDGSDVRMVERGQHFRFALEARQPVGVSGERRRQDLDRHLAFEARIGRPIHLSHPALAEQGGNLVDTDASSG